MQQALIVIGGWLTSVTIAYTVYCIKGNNKDNKIDIMSVRSRIRKIDRINKEDKKVYFKI